MMVLCGVMASAQELEVKINLNTQQIERTDKTVFDNLQQTLEQWMNDRQWTELQFQKHERITVNFNLTVTKYDPSSNLFECTALIQANRPVFNATYNSTLYNNKDAQFNFQFAQFDQLNFNDEMVGGTDILMRCMHLVNNAQDLGFSGWKSFEDSRNRFAIINDYLDEQMKPFRQLQYDYYRTGLDEMANNVERGRTNISEALEKDLKVAHEQKPLSLLPQIWTDYKRDEIANIYEGKGTQKEKQAIYDMLMSINAAQNEAWEKIRK